VRATRSIRRGGASGATPWRGALLEEAQRCERLSDQEREALADRLQDAAMQHFHSMHKLRPGGR